MTWINYYGVTTETGGGKKPIRKRHNQNYKLWSKFYSEENCINMGRTYLLEYLNLRTEGKVTGTCLTVVKVGKNIIK